ncbi:hypothetical protein PR048_006547 [Dryococelus australis]|uniref:Uncharacterized protein n=1 Tax=Dryococelus australis TaxID=614101 RepID=A0ABQ9IC93_9NEOP|nr:hypothetical protein PR048_006547 [Dryococelus australis]
MGREISPAAQDKTSCLKTEMLGCQHDYHKQRVSDSKLDDAYRVNHTHHEPDVNRPVIRDTPKWGETDRSYDYVVPMALIGFVGHRPRDRMLSAAPSSFLERMSFQALSPRRTQAMTSPNGGCLKYDMSVMTLLQGEGGPSSIEGGKMGGGGTVAERLACSPPTKTIWVKSPAGSLRILVCGNRAGRTMPFVGRFFSGIFRFPRPFIPALLHTHLTKPSHTSMVDGLCPHSSGAEWPTCNLMVGSSRPGPCAADPQLSCRAHAHYEFVISSVSLERLLRAGEREGGDSGCPGSLRSRSCEEIVVIFDFGLFECRRQPAVPLSNVTRVAIGVREGCHAARVRHARRDERQTNTYHFLNPNSAKRPMTASNAHVSLEHGTLRYITFINTTNSSQRIPNNKVVVSSSMHAHILSAWIAGNWWRGMTRPGMCGGRAKQTWERDKLISLTVAERHSELAATLNKYAHMTLILFFPICGVALAERLARSPSTKAIQVQSSAGSPDFRMWKSCRTMPLVGGFSRGSPRFPAPSFRRCSLLTSLALVISEDLAIKSCPNRFTHSLTSSLYNDLHSMSKIPQIHDGGWGSALTTAGPFRSQWEANHCVYLSTLIYKHARLPPRRTGFNTRPAHRIFVSGNRAERCRWSVGFLGDLPFPPPLLSGAAPYSLQSPSSALKTSLLRAAHISSIILYRLYLAADVLPFPLASEVILLVLANRVWDANRNMRSHRPLTIADCPDELPRSPGYSLRPFTCEE